MRTYCQGLSYLNSTPQAREKEEKEDNTDDPIRQEMTDDSDDYSSK